MALTRDHFETTKKMLREDSEYRVAFLGEAINCFVSGEADVAKNLLRKYIKATIGFDKLAKMMHKEPQAVMRMLRPSGNPSMDNLSKLLASLRKHEGVSAQVR